MREKWNTSVCFSLLFFFSPNVTFMLNYVTAEQCGSQTSRILSHISCAPVSTDIFRYKGDLVRCVLHTLLKGLLQKSSCLCDPAAASLDGLRWHCRLQRLQTHTAVWGKHHRCEVKLTEGQDWEIQMKLQIHLLLQQHTLRIITHQRWVTDISEHVQGQQRFQRAQTSVR